MNSNEIKEQLIYYLDKNKKYKKEQLVKYIGQNIDKELSELELEGLIYKDKNELYSNFPDHLVQGKIHFNKNDATISINNTLYKIKIDELNDVLDGDLVIIKPTNIFEKGAKIATIEKILNRETGNIIVEVLEKNDQKYVKDIQNRFKKTIYLQNHILKDYVYGDRLLVNIGLYSTKDYYKAELVSFICNKNDPDKEIKTILVNNGFTIGHSEESMRETNSLPNNVTMKDIIGRKDFRNLLTISIDGSNTKDRDDAFSIVKLNNDHYLLIIHISAVSYYVRPGMALWKEAMEKGTSVYPLDYVEPMFPKKLSNGICSLDEGVDRLTESTIIEIDSEGNIINHETVPGVINSNKACTYEDVNKILNDNEMIDGYEEIYPLLLTAYELSKILEKRMLDKNFLDFNSTDIHVSRNDKGEIDKITETTMGSSQKIIEFFMVLADEIAALESILPMIYRIHEEPDAKKINNVIKYIKKIDEDISFHTKSNSIQAKHIKYLLEQIKDTNLEQEISSLLISSMKQARYSSINIGHFALALSAYIQITSPIRRAGDLWNQYYRIQQREGTKYTNNDYNELYTKAYKLAGHLTNKEISSEKVERESLDLVSARYYTKNIDELINAKVTYLSKKYIKIKTSDGIKGVLQLGKKYKFNQGTNSYINKENNFKLTIGTPIVVTPERVNEDNSLVFKLK